MKRNSDLKSILLIFTIILLFFNSCMSDVDLLNVSKDIKIDQSLVIPVGEAKLTIKDVLNKFGLPTGIDTLSTEIYMQNTASTEYTFKPVNLADSVKPFSKTLAPIPFPVIYPANTAITLPPAPDTLALGINGNVGQQRIDTIKLTSALINVKIDGTADIKAIPASDIRVEFVFPSDKLKIDNGVNPTFIPTAYGATGQISMGSFKITPKGATKIPFNINVYVKKQSSPLSLGPGSKIFINMSFVTISFNQAWGMFKMALGDTQTMNFNIASAIPNGYLKFESPTVDITASSNIGLDALIKLNYIKSYNQSTPTIFNYAWFNGHTSNSVNLNLNGPSVLGNTATTSFSQFNNTNGEIDKLINTNPYPNTLEYKYTVTNNPLSTRTTNFVTADSKIKFDMKTRIKLSFNQGSYYTIKDTIRNVGTSLGTALDGVDSAVLVLNFANGLPVKAIYRMTFWKSNAANDTIACAVNSIKNDSTLGTIFSKYQLNPPDINADGTVKTIKNQILTIGLSKATIADLKKTKFIVYSLALAGDQTVVGGVPTTNPIHFTTTNSFGLRLGVFLKANTTVTLSKTNKSK